LNNKKPFHLSKNGNPTNLFKKIDSRDEPKNEMHGINVGNRRPKNIIRINLNKGNNFIGMGENLNKIGEEQK